MAQIPQNVTGYFHEDAWDTNWLKVDDTHEIYYEQYGPKDGKPLIYLHGGPGGHITKSNTQFFNPKHYRVILLDQRGCGKSRPNASTKDNTTWHLVSDIESLRNHLSIPKWHVFGGSWGSTLALAYAQTHPSSVLSLILRGIFCVRQLELNWTMQPGGAAMLFPDAFDEFINFLPENERADHITNYHKRLISDDTSVSHPAARAWNKWEVNMSTLYPNIAGMSQLDDPAWLLAHARIEAHYFQNGAWLDEGRELLAKENLVKLKGIPGSIVQGRYDVVCPPVTAWELHKKWPESRLFWVSDAGHSATEPGTKKKLMEVCDEYASL